MGNSQNGLLIDAMYVLYQETAAQLLQSRQNMNVTLDKSWGEMFSPGDMVLLKDPEKGKRNLLPRYNNTYRVL